MKKQKYKNGYTMNHPKIYINKNLLICTKQLIKKTTYSMKNMILTLRLG